MEVAERNRKLKQVLGAEFGKGKVWVRGSRGTAYGWVSVTIESSQPRETVRERVWSLMKEHGIEVGTYGYDDPGSDYGYGSKLSLNVRQGVDDETAAD